VVKIVNIVRHNSLQDLHKIIKQTKNLELKYIEKLLANPTISSKQIYKELFIDKNTFFKWLKWYNPNYAIKIHKFAPIIYE